MHRHISVVFKTMDRELCIVCCKPIGLDDVYTATCCGKKLVHDSCMNQHAHYCRREYLKNHQNLEDFTVFCMFCKQDSGYVITQQPTFSIPSSLSDSLPVESLTVSGFTSLINTGDNDPSYYPEAHVPEHEILDISSELNGLKYCATCAKPLDTVDDQVQLVCCWRIVHESCHSVTTTILKKLDMNRCYRGNACLVCSSSRYMVMKDYSLCMDEEQIDIIDGIHPMAASPNAHYMMTRCVLYLHGFNFQEKNPWSLKDTFEKFPVLLEELNKAKKHFVESPQDMEILDGIASQTTTIGKLRNVFLDPDRAIDIMGRTPNCEPIMYQLFMIYREAKRLYISVSQKLLDLHVDTVNRIEHATLNTIVHPPKHTCMKPCCRTLCVEAHPTIHIPTTGSLPVPSAPLPVLNNPARSGPSRPRIGMVFESPTRPTKTSNSCMQASCVNTPPENRGISPRKLTQKDLLMCVIQDMTESPTLSTVVKTLKGIGKLDENKPNEYHTLLELVINTTCEEDLKLIATIMYGGDMKKKMKLV